MGMDDDDDCVDHEWGLDEVRLTERGAEMTSTCVRCGALSFEPSKGQRDGS